MRYKLCFLLLLSLCLAGSTTRATTQAPHAKLGQFCRNGAIEGRVLDPNYSPVGHAHVELLVTSRGNNQRVLLHTVETGDDGHFTIPCPQVEVFELRITATGYNTLNVAEDFEVASSDTLTLQLVPPCTGAITSATPLTPADRSQIYSVLLNLAFNNRTWTALCTDNLDSVKATLVIPPNVRFLTMPEIRKLSKKSTVTYVVLSQLDTDGGCVKAGYFATCMTKGQDCVLCCESQDFYFYRGAGAWKSQWTGGAVY